MSHLNFVITTHERRFKSRRPHQGTHTHKNHSSDEGSNSSARTKGATPPKKRETNNDGSNYDTSSSEADEERMIDVVYANK